MTQVHIQSLKAEARRRVGAFPTDIRMLVLVYCGVLAALSLAGSGLQFYLDSQISSTGGLGGLGMRSVLQTVESVLSYINTFFGPFWQAGFLFCIIGIVRRQQTGPKNLTEGFRRFGRVLSYTLNTALITIILSIGAVYISSFLFSLSPWGRDFAEAMGPVMTDPNLFTAEGAINMDLIPMDAMMIAVPAMVVIFALVFTPMQLFVSYALRLGQYLLMEGKHMTGMAAIMLSWKMTKGHRLQFLKLDLSYWWYYVLLFVAGIVGYLDVILALAGISVPIDAKVLYFMTMGAYLALELVISLWKKCEVDAASVLLCESICHPDTAAEAAPADPA